MTAILSMPRCVDCLFWKRWGSRRSYGQCRRFPPTVGEAPDEAHFTQTTEQDWCGEHKETRDLEADG